MEKISIIIPAHNEEKRINKTLERYLDYFSNLKKQGLLDFEIIIVLNACVDNTQDVVNSFKSKEIIILDFVQGGKGFAIIEGFKDALKRDSDLIGFVDADMATPPNAFYGLVRNIKIDEGIIGNRWSSESKIGSRQPLMRRITSRGFNFLVRSFFLFNYRDTQCGAKIFKRKVVEKITNSLKLTEWAFDINLLYLCKRENFKVKECPTEWNDCEDSKLDLATVPLKMFSGILRLRLIYSPFAEILKPVKFILKIGDNLLNKK